MKNKLLSMPERIFVELSRQKTRDKVAYMKLSVLIFLDEGLTQEQTANLLGTSEGTVGNYKKKYEELGLSKFLDTHM